MIVIFPLRLPVRPAAVLTAPLHGLPSVPSPPVARTSIDVALYLPPFQPLFRLCYA